MIGEIVKRLIGVEDSPKWLEREVYKKIEEGLAVVDAVNYLAPWLWKIYKSNVIRHKPGRSSVRKASHFLVAEFLEQLGYEVTFVQLFGTTLPAAKSSRGDVPVLPLFDTKRKSLYLAAKAKKLGIVTVTTERLEGVTAEVIKLDKSPYYYLFVPNLKKYIETAPPIAAEVDKKNLDLYYYWRYFRQRGYLVLVEKEIGGVEVDILAVGLGKYAVVREGNRRVTRLKKLVDAVYLV